MAILRRKQKLGAVAKENQEVHPRNSQSKETTVPRINENYITQVSKEIKWKMRKKLSQELSRTEIGLLGALSKLDDFFLNAQVQVQLATVLGTVFGKPGVK